MSVPVSDTNIIEDAKQDKNIIEDTIQDTNINEVTNQNLNIIEQFEKMDPTKLFTTNEILDSVQIFDSTVEIIGYIDGIESPRFVGNKQQYQVFKFYLNNGTGRRVQVVAWNNEIEKILHHILPNYVNSYFSKFKLLY